MDMASAHFAGIAFVLALSFACKAGSTLTSSRAVPHPSTNRALRRLTLEVGRDPVHSTRHGRQRQTFSARRIVLGVCCSLSRTARLSWLCLMLAQVAGLRHWNFEFLNSTLCNLKLWNVKLSEFELWNLQP